MESRLEVVTRDYVPPSKHEVKRSKSTPAVVSEIFLDQLEFPDISSIIPRTA